ncbi:MAG: TonB-dependent receptor [Bacteroidales bacterium]|nr:TonB-dependent receptor [Bacteroidales bacterium]MDZ4204015.1 TonB-dependent receptor [Bacteroidales bacterium]
MRKTIHIFTYAIFSIFLVSGFAYAQPSRFTLSGFVYEKGSRESLPGVNVYIPEQRQGTTTNNYGFYSITLPAGTYQVAYSYVGYAPQVFEIKLDKSISLDVLLDPSIELTGVEVTGERIPAITENPLMSVIDLPVKQIQSIPALLGEKDVLKIIQLMPGVQKGTEGTSGFYVRGGGADQNLIILDDAIVYNASHLFGFFSVFNGDAIKSVQLTKGGFPARFGGRLSSVLEMNMKDGNMERFSGEAGIGFISSRLVLEGPIKKEKSSFIVSGRRTYFDALLLPFMPKDERGGYYFYDLNAKINYSINPKNRIYASAYFGRDKFYAKFRDFYTKTEAGFYWQNATGTLRWNHLFNNRLFGNASVIFSNYKFSIYMHEKYDKLWYDLSYQSGIRDWSIKYDLNYAPHPNHSIRIGILSTLHRFTPSAVVLRDDYVKEYKKDVKAIDVLESGIYIEDEIRVGSHIRANAGFRLSHFIDGKKSYMKPEPRISLSYLAQRDLAIKASYAEMNQYVHLLSNTGLGLPTDLWVPSTKNIAPQTSRQVALGAAKDLKNKNLEISIEAYYKKSFNTLGYAEGASFLLFGDPTNAEEVDWEKNITKGQAWSYGVELLLQRKTGQLTGWVGYTLSWTQLQFDELNVGKKFYARYDRRHDISVVGIYEFSKRFVLSGTWVYGTGNAITLPIGEYSSFPHEYPGSDYFSSWGWYVNDYGEKNNFRMAAYHRFDLGLQFITHAKKYKAVFEVSAYNLYNRKNPFFYFMGHDGRDQRVLRQVSIFPIIPSVSYSIKF